MSQIKTPKLLLDSSVRLLTDRLRDEYVAHYFYRSATNWCKGIGYIKAAAFFAEEAESELEHAKKLQTFLVDWNIEPSLPSIKPNIQFTDLVDIVNKAYVMEYSLFDSYCKDSHTVFQTDINTFDFLTMVPLTMQYSWDLTPQALCSANILTYGLKVAPMVLWATNRLPKPYHSRLKNTLIQIVN
jgi:ferritin